MIGPNGAGKSTVFNVITGVYSPSAGDVRLAGKSIAGKRTTKITRLGIARTFQSLRLFLNMTVKENVKAATYGGTKASPPESILRLPRARREEREVDKLAEEVLVVLRPAAAGLPLGPASLQPLLREPPAARDRARAGDQAEAAVARRARRRHESVRDARGDGADRPSAG